MESKSASIRSFGWFRTVRVPFYLILSALYTFFAWFEKTKSFGEVETEPDY